MAGIWGAGRRFSDDRTVIPEESDRLGKAVEEYLSRRQNQFHKGISITGAWETILPQAFREQCRLVDISSGVITVETTCGAYMHQFQMAKHQLLEELKKMCPAAGIKKIILRPKK